MTSFSQLLRGTFALLGRLVVALVVGGIVLLTLAQQAGSIGPWWLELSRYLPYPALLLPGAVAVLLALALGRVWLVASTAALALAATVTAGFEWHTVVAPRADRVRVRVMTYNIKAANAVQRPDGVAALGREIALHRPDILLLQDARGLPGKRDGGADPLAALTGLPQVYASGQFIVASRFALRDCASHGLGDFAHVHCVVDVNGVALNLVTAHFESPRTGLNAARHDGLDGTDEWRRNYAERLAQARALAHELAHGARPLIVAGDLNAPESSPVIRALLDSGLRDAFSGAGRGYGHSYGHALRPGFSFLRIDHVLVSPELGLADCFVGGSAASEHRPVIADLLLRR